MPLAGAHPAAVRFGKTGVLRIAPLGTSEPTSVSSAWPAGWHMLGYTDVGSNWNVAISAGNVEVAEEVDILARVIESRDVTVEVALAETTLRNLTLAYGSGVLVTPTGANWTFDLPSMDAASTHVMLGWDALQTPANNDLRVLWRDALQTGNVGSEQRKGTQKSLLSVTFSMSVPDTGLAVATYWGAAKYNPAA